jgi:hypothetical protein
MMPRTRSRPPKVLSGRRKYAIVFLILALELLQLFFVFFWLTGPAVAAVGCTSVTNDLIGTDVTNLGGKFAALVCAAAAATAGFYMSPALVSFGSVLAMVIGFFTWMTLGLILILTDSRVFIEEPRSLVWYISSLAISLIPLANGFFELTLTAWRILNAQTKKERVKLKVWEAAHAEQLAIERAQRTAALAAARAFSEAEAEEQFLSEEALEQESLEADAEEQEKEEMAEAEERSRQEQQTQEEAVRTAAEKAAADSRAYALAQTRQQEARAIEEAAQNNYHEEIEATQNIARVVSLAQARRRNRLREHTMKQAYEIPGEGGRAGA